MAFIGAVISKASPIVPIAFLSLIILFTFALHGSQFLYVLKLKPKYKLIITENYDPKHYKSLGLRVEEVKTPLSRGKRYKVYVNGRFFIV